MSALIEVEDLAKTFDVSAPWLNRVIEHKPQQFVHADDGVTFSIERGTTLALVGESGCSRRTFFARLLAKNYLAGVAPEKGNFRSFLLASLKHFLANEWDRARAAKRGGGQMIISLDDTEAEERYRLEPVDNMTADKLFDRRWVMTLLEQVMRRLRSEYSQAGNEELYERLKDCLAGSRESAPYAQVAAELRLSEGAVKVAAHRLRARYREMLREEIAQTVTTQAEADAEILISWRRQPWAQMP